ncbi:hypothetical protein L6452_02364 [Arctium lappa]|uniref:Uncharacterized protein n=1 Tax=Arctium lappa TaxID=4217 RepID=A0ACB9FK63_ARCLA|nr:hypothetical protein L6452_02364 [Arctium lappa]
MPLFLCCVWPEKEGLAIWGWRYPKQVKEVVVPAGGYPNLSHPIFFYFYHNTIYSGFRSYEDSITLLCPNPMSHTVAVRVDTL